MTKQHTQHTPQAPYDKMQTLAQWLHEKHATDIIALDVTGICSVTEGIVIATAGSHRHAQALSDWICSKGKKETDYLGLEGYQGGTWILLDFNDVLVHIFQQQARTFYNVEGLWAQAPRVPLALPE